MLTVITDEELTAIRQVVLKLYIIILLYRV